MFSRVDKSRGTGWLKVLGHGDPTKSCTCRDSFDTSFKGGVREKGTNIFLALLLANPFKIEFEVTAKSIWRHLIIIWIYWSSQRRRQGCKGRFRSHQRMNGNWRHGSGCDHQRGDAEYKSEGLQKEWCKVLWQLGREAQNWNWVYIFPDTFIIHILIYSVRKVGQHCG